MGTLGTNSNSLCEFIQFIQWKQTIRFALMMTLCIFLSFVISLEIWQQCNKFIRIWESEYCIGQILFIFKLFILHFVETICILRRIKSIITEILRVMISMTSYTSSTDSLRNDEPLSCISFFKWASEQWLHNVNNSTYTSNHSS